MPVARSFIAAVRRALALATLTLALGACDRQNTAQPQGGGQAAAAVVPDAATQPLPKADGARYRILRDAAGSDMPDNEVANERNVATRLRSLVGQPTLINLWATWCAPCVEELPTLDAVAAANAGTGHVVVISQDIGDGSEPRAFLQQRGWTRLTGWHDPENLLGIAYGGQLPVTLLFNAEGKEVARVVGPLDWRGGEAAALLREAGLSAPR